jgi:anaerobic selenocysteine-containing dehydrogenase
VAPCTPHFGTPSGRIEFASSLLEQWGLDPLPGFARPELFDRSAEYPLVLTTGGRYIEGFHQDAQKMPWFLRKYPEPVVRMHPDTGAAHGIADGDWTRIETPVGNVRQRARLTRDLARGTIHADRWWYPEQANDRADPFGVAAVNINCCTTDSANDSDPVMGSWLLRGLPCRIRASG